MFSFLIQYFYLVLDELQTEFLEFRKFILKINIQYFEY